MSPVTCGKIIRLHDIIIVILLTIILCLHRPIGIRIIMEGISRSRRTRLIESSYIDPNLHQIQSERLGKLRQKNKVKYEIASNTHDRHR